MLSKGARAGFSGRGVSTILARRYSLTFMRAFFRQPFDDVLACLGHVMVVRRPAGSLITFVIGMVLSWIVYVPIHELLHAAGCVASGGRISALEISPRYGGAILERHLDFVVAGGKYAGRLSGFDTRGSDLIYLATDFGPYLLTVLLGVPLIAACTKKRRPILFAVASVVGLAPFYNIPGDYFEMGSIVTTRALSLFAEAGSPIAFEGIRSDDVFSLVANILTLGVTMGSGGFFACGVLLFLVGVSLTVDVLLAFLTYAAGRGVANLAMRPTTGAPAA